MQLPSRGNNIELCCVVFTNQFLMFFTLAQSNRKNECFCFVFGLFKCTVFVLLNAHCAEVITGCAFIYLQKMAIYLSRQRIEVSLTVDKHDPRSCPILSLGK